MEEVSLGQLVGTAVKFTIAFSLVESFNAVVMRGYSHLFIDKCKTCRGSGVVKCRHCKGYGSVRVWPATVDEVPRLLAISTSSCSADESCTSWRSAGYAVWGTTRWNRSSMASVG